MQRGEGRLVDAEREGHGVDNGVDRGRVDVADKMPAQSWTPKTIQ